MTLPMYNNKSPEYEQMFNDFADAILSLPIDVPSEKEIKESSQHYIKKHIIDRPVQWTYIDGYEDAISEIIKRNQK
jgi:disulfide oxidoreductase YuzD